MRFLQFPKSSLTLAQEFFQVIIKESVLLWIWVLSLYFNSDQEFFLNNIGNSLSEFLC